MATFIEKKTPFKTIVESLKRCLLVQNLTNIPRLFNRNGNPPNICEDSASNKKNSPNRRINPRVLGSYAESGFSDIGLRILAIYFRVFNQQIDLVKKQG